MRSTRRRDDVPDLPRLKVEERTLGRTFTGRDGKTWRPSMFVTLTLGSYGRVRSDGTPVDPASYDYRRAALDALHLSKLWDRFTKNLRRAVGYEVQYFATLEPQRRLAPHLHVAIRGAIPRRLLRQVIAATYASLWWPAHEEVIYAGKHVPKWDDKKGGYVDPDTRRQLPTWEQALDELDADPDAEPAHVVRFGKQSDMQGIIAGTDKADRRIGYLTKYLTKAINDPLDGDEDEVSPARRAHVERLHAQVRILPCSKQCANWLAYGIQPKNAHDGMRPGECRAKAHDRQHLGCGGRRVLVSRYWTGKTLTEHKADRLGAVRAVLEAAGIDADDTNGCSATGRRRGRATALPVAGTRPGRPAHLRLRHHLHHRPPQPVATPVRTGQTTRRTCVRQFGNRPRGMTGKGRYRGHGTTVDDRGSGRAAGGVEVDGCPADQRAAGRECAVGRCRRITSSSLSSYMDELIEEVA